MSRRLGALTLDMFAKRSSDGLLELDATLAALGRDGIMGSRMADVPLAQIAGTAARTGDFDADFRLCNKGLRDRWYRLVTVMAGSEVPPVELIQLGELYFVVDGHHRVSVAKALGRAVITAKVLRVCTVAFGLACLRPIHLPIKAAERRFLDRVPLPDVVRADLWLDHAADWARLADSVEAWGYRQTLAGRRLTDRVELAGNWWAEEVVPVLKAARAAGVLPGLREVQQYVALRAAHDHFGWHSWPPSAADLASLDG